MLEGEFTGLGYFCSLRTKKGPSSSSTSYNHGYSSVCFSFSSRPPQRFCSHRFNLVWCDLPGLFSVRKARRSCSAAHSWLCFPCGFLLAASRSPPWMPRWARSGGAGHTSSALTLLLTEHIQVRLLQSGIIWISLAVINISLISQLQ